MASYSWRGGGGSPVNLAVPWVMRFDGTNHFDLGRISPAGVNLSLSFTIRALVKINAFTVGYFLAPGYGGRHVPLMGFAGDQFSGNCGQTDGVTVDDITFSHWYQFAIGEWVLIELIGDGTNAVRLYFDGMYMGQWSFTRTARFWDAVSQNTRHFLGAAGGHNGFHGDVADFALNDRQSMYDPTQLATLCAHGAEKFPSAAYEYGGPTIRKWDLLLDFWDKNWTDKSADGLVADATYTTAGGFAGRHNGFPFNPSYGGEQSTPGTSALVSGTNLPTFIQDPTCPKYPGATPIENSRTPATPYALSNLVMFDSFGRGKQTELWYEQTTLGQTEQVGGQPQLTWQTSKVLNADAARRNVFGIWGGMAVPIVRNYCGMAYVQHATLFTSKYRVRVTPHSGGGGLAKATGGVVRVRDSSSALIFFSEGNNARLAEIVSNSFSTAGYPTLAMPSNWAELTCDVDDGANTLQLGYATTPGGTVTLLGSPFSTSLLSGLHSGLRGVGMWGNDGSHRIDTIAVETL